MNIVLNTKEIHIIKIYIDEMLVLFNEKDMINAEEPLHLSPKDILVYKKDFLNLNKKLNLI